MHWFGTERDYNAMVIDLPGLSLEDLFNFCDRKFLADQLGSCVGVECTISYLLTAS